VVLNQRNILQTKNIDQSVSTPNSSQQTGLGQVRSKYRPIFKNQAKEKVVTHEKKQIGPQNSKVFFPQKY
jgi:hypothetical protein